MEFYLVLFVADFSAFSTILGLEPSTAEEANLILVEMHSSSIRIEICICLKQTVIFLSIEIVLSEYFSSFRYSDF